MSNDTLSDQLDEIYRLMCREALNREYYGVMLARNQKLATILDVLIAIGTTGSGISALTVWGTEYGRPIYTTLSAISAVLALTKPIIQLNKTVERLSRLFVGHADNYASLLILVSRIRRKRDITEEMLVIFDNAEAKYLELAKEDDPTPNLKVTRRCDDIVRNATRQILFGFQSKSLTATMTRHKKAALRGGSSASASRNSPL